MPGTRERIVDSSAELFRRQGYTGTGVKQIVAAASAPFGSLYHFFPGGKAQLGEEVIRWSGQMYLQLFVTVAGDAPDVATGVERFFAGAAETLEETGYADACPIATVALEVASTNEPPRKATADGFDSWGGEGFEAVDAADAVVFAAGAGSGSGADRKWTVDYAGAAKLIVAAKATGVRRYVMVSAMGAGSPPSGDEVFAVYLRAKARADEELRRSGLDWTIARPGRLTDEPGTGRVEAGGGGARGEISRDDGAATPLAGPGERGP